MPEILITGPAGEPLDTQHAKDQCRISDTSQDHLLPALIAHARQFAEMRTQRQLIHARYQYVIDVFPQAGFCSGPAFTAMVNIPPNAIVLPHAPVARVVSIQYLDMAGAQQTMASTDYAVNAAMAPALITPKFGKIWPIAVPQIGAISITYDAGYATPIAAFAGDTLTIPGPMTWAIDDAVRFSNSGGALPTQLKAFTDYYVVALPGANQYKFSATKGGSAIGSYSGNSGTCYVGEVPGGILAWMLVRLATLFDQRDEVAVATRGKLEALPYVDGMLDPFRVLLP
jgi:uncharacterized phiE125 gp8 family phage protein